MSDPSFFLSGTPASTSSPASPASSSAATPTTGASTLTSSGFDDTAGLQSEITANQTIIQNKPGPECPDNVLHNYANYTYKISVLAWDSIKEYNKEIQFGSWNSLKNSMNNKKILFSSGGIADDAVTVSIPGTSVTTAARHPDFDVDFYISAFSTTSIMGMSGESRNTNIFECNMEVVEPIGVTLLERIYSLVTKDGRENWADYPLLIKIEFVGYDDAGTPEYIEPALRMIPVRIINMAFDASGEGSTYSIQFLAQAQQKWEGVSLDATELYGKTVKDFLDQFAEMYNKHQQGLTQAGSKAAEGMADEFTVSSYDELTTAKVQEVNDEIEFDIDPRIADARIAVTVAEDTPLLPGPPSAAVDDYAMLTTAGRQKAKEKAEANKKIIDLDPEKDTKITIAKGTKQIAAIEKIIPYSTYITDQLLETDTLLAGTSKSKLKDKKLLKNPDQGLLWWKVTYVPTIKPWDDIRGKYGRKTTIQITPYRVNDPVTTGGECNIGEGVIAPAMRNYQYIYTGQNIDITDFGITFNNSFIQSMVGMGTDNQSGKKITPKKRVEQGPVKDKANALQSSSADAIDKSYSTGSKNKTNKQSTSGTILENLYRQLGSDMMQCTINIVGDPMYIQQDGLLNLGRTAKVGTIDNPTILDPANGAALCDHQDAHIFLSYKTPTDYNEETGLMDFNMGDAKHRSSTLSGYYRVWEVVNTFQGGAFNQSLNLTRVYNQWREAKHNPLKKGGGNDKGDFAFEDARANAIGAISTSGGSAKTETTSEAVLSRNQQKQIATQQRTLQKQIDIERRAVLREPTDPGVLSEHDFKNISSNTSIANQNAANRQNTDEAKIKFKAAQARLANINTISDTSSLGQQDTFTDIIAAKGNNTDTLSQTFDNDSLNPIFSEKTGQPTHTTVDGLRSNALHTKLTDVGNNTSIVSTDPNGTPIFSYNKKEGAYGLNETGINMASYSDADRTSVNTNDEIIRTQREALIATGDLVAKKAAYNTANAASKDNQTTHGKYGNVYRTWEEVGYFKDLR